MPSVQQIQVIANSQPHTTEADISLPDFLASIGLYIEHVVVERNREALTPAEARSTTLQDGDRLEILKIMAGG